MTRRKWSELRDAHLQEPEDRARYERARQELEAELAEEPGPVEFFESLERTEDDDEAWQDRTDAAEARERRI